MRSQQILVVDDEPLVCKSISEVIHRAGYDVLTANDSYEALDILQQEPVSVIIADLNMPKMSGLELLKRVKNMFPDLYVIIITGYGTIDSAVEAMKNGAFDFITKPFSPSKINSVIQKIFTIKSSTTKSASQSKSFDIVTSDPTMLSILDKIKLIAQSDSNVMIQGESGTGKELVARAIHRLSNRANGPYIAVNCAAIPESLIESELFGHEKGSFTGAIARRIGTLELANGGTLLLDEISEMPKALQAKLLRAIQEREIVRVGGNQRLNVNVRIVATTNKDLIQEVDEGRFREDLFYRLCVIPIFLPPLRERKDDIPLLAQYFAEKYATKMGKKVPTIPKEVINILVNYDWPGNVRELENTIERAIALSTNGSIKIEDISFTYRRPITGSVSFRIGTSIDQVEKELILKTLDHVGWNKQKAADILGITTKTIRNKLRQYGYANDDSSADLNEELNYPA